MNHEQIAIVLRNLESKYGWNPIMEGQNIIGVTYQGQSVTLEPGGQFELSGAPVESLQQTCAEVNSHLSQAREYT
jgi:glutamate--cysteine ligase